MVQAVDDGAQQSLDFDEVQQQPGRIQPFAFQHDQNLVVVAVNFLALTPVAAQGMSSRESLFYRDLKH